MRARATPERNGRPTGVDGHSPTPLFGDEHSEAEWEEYLDQRRRGITPDLAARAIGLTGTAMKRYLRREPERAAEVEAAASEGEIHYRERLRATARALALNTDNPQPRLLEVELATHVPGYEHLRRDRVRHEGHITHGITIDLDPEKLDSLPLEEIEAAIAALRRIGGEVIDGTATEIRELTA